MMTEINKDIYRQEQRHVVCQPEKSQRKQRHKEMSIELNSPPIKPVACSKCLVDNDDIWFSKV